MDHYPFDNRYLEDRISYHARGLVGQYGYEQQDFEDIKQDLFVLALPVLPTFDPSRSQPNTFLERVIRHAVSDLTRRRSAQKRQHPTMISMDTITCDHPDSRGHDPISADTPTAQQPGYVHEFQECLELLSDEEQDICARLKTQSMHATAKQLGISRYLLEQKIKTIRERLEQLGIYNDF